MPDPTHIVKPLFFRQAFVLLLFFYASLAGSTALQAQQVNAGLVPDSILIGERAVLWVEVSVPAKSFIVPLALNDTIFNKLEILSVTLPDTLESDSGNVFIRQKFEITAWEEGYYPIAPLKVWFIQGQDTLEVSSQPMLLGVYPVELAEDATPYDIKPILKMPLSFMDVFRWVGPILFVIVLFTGLAWWFMKRRRSRPQAESVWEKPDIPPHIAAISSLESLKNKKLWQNGKVKLYHSELTYIIRMFIEKRFGLLALEMTSGEIILNIQVHFKEGDLTDSLRYILEIADLVKFAKFVPDPQQNEESMDLALEFVKRNIPTSPTAEKKTMLKGEE